jgi:hypothetical protein
MLHRLADVGDEEDVAVLVFVVSGSYEEWCH